MNLLRRSLSVLGTTPVDPGKWSPSALLAMICPLLVFASISCSSESKTHLQIGLDEQQYEALSDFKPGDGTMIKLTGDAAKEYFRLAFPDRTFKPGYYVDMIAKIAGADSDGQLILENQLSVESQRKTPQMCAIRAVAPPSQIKLLPPPTGAQLVPVEVEGPDGKTHPVKIVYKGDQPTLELPWDPEAKVEMDIGKVDRRYVEISDLKQVTLKLWELKEQVGK